MKRDDIIKLAREAGIEFDLIDEEEGQIWYITSEGLHRFAALIAAAAIKDAPDYKMGYADGAAVEREACEKIALDQDHLIPHWPQATVQQSIAAAIRARG